MTRARRTSTAGLSVLVTGATSGIGRATAQRLADHGATVLATARDGAALAELARHPRIVARPADLTDAEERAALMTWAVSQTGAGSQPGGLDALVADAGIGMTAAVTEMTAAQIAKVVDTNVTATIDLVRLALPSLESRSGHVVLLASAASWCAMPPLTVYATTKYAVAGFAEGLRREVAGRGIRVHSVHPGFVATQFAARSTGPDPGELAGPARSGPGIPPAWVARAVEGCLRHPGRRCVAVPRVAGATRVVKLPGLNRVADGVVAALAPSLLRLGRRVAERAADPQR